MSTELLTPAQTEQEMVSQQRKMYRIGLAQGVRRMTPAEPTRHHLAYLSEQAVGRRTVARALGFAELTLMRISKGQSRLVKVETERRILAFQPEHAHTIANARVVDATATRLRFQALVALGYTQEGIAHSIGRTHADIEIGERIYRWRALAILELARQIADTPGPSAKASARARRNGWRPPADYDETLFYDPAWDGTEPPPAARIAAKAYYLEEYDFLSQYMGPDVGPIAARLGITRGYLIQLLRRQDDPSNVPPASLTG